MQTNGASAASSQLVRDESWCSHVVVTLFATLLHALACVFYAHMAKLHVYIQHKPEAARMLAFIGDNLFDFFPYVVAVSVVFAVVHGVAALDPVWRALPLRRFKRERVAQVAYPCESPYRSTPGIRRSWYKRAARALARWDQALEHRTGVDSYELLVLVEIGLQTYQANKLSNLVATLWINRLVVFVIVVNCWFVPAVSVAFRKKTPTFVKVVHLALDSILEVVYGMVVPLAIFYPYYRDAMSILYDISSPTFYHDTWAINSVAENQQLYVTSWIDFCSKMTPGVSLFVRLYALRTHQAEHEVHTKIASRRRIAPETSVDVVQPQFVLHKKRVLIALMVLWGLGVLTLHIVATGVGLAQHNVSCLLENVPFGSMKYACAVFEVSCSQRHIVGTKSELDAALSQIDPARVEGLIFSHCPALAMPPRLKTFPRLSMIKIHNCSIAEWGADAALTAHDHPNLQILYTTLTNMSAIPDGLLSPQFPPHLADIEICGSNLTALPPDLFDKWKPDYFILELSPGITEFPHALRSAAATLSMLMLASNAITSIPDDLFLTHSYAAFLVSGNPLTALPQHPGSIFTANSVAIDLTDIADIPASWRDAAAQQANTSALAMSAWGTPLCDSLLQSQTAASSSSSSMDSLSWLSCSTPARHSKPHIYPLEHELEWRAKNRV